MKTPQEIAEMISKRFYPLPDADLDSLASIIESSKAAKGELLLDNGQISKYLYYVESGLLRQFYYKNKRDITEHFSCEGNIVICIASTFQREPTRLLIEALEPTVYHRISFSEFSDLLKTSLAINRLYQKILEWALSFRKRKRTLGVLSRQENVICVFNRNIRKQRNVLLSIISPRIY